MSADAERLWQGTRDTGMSRDAVLCCQLRQNDEQPELSSLFHCLHVVSLNARLTSVSMQIANRYRLYTVVGIWQKCVLHQETKIITTV